MNTDPRTVLITGGGSGIGAACALALAEAGHDVAIAGRRTSLLEDVASRSRGPRPLRLQAADVADRDSVARLFEWAGRELDRVDVLVNSAGINVPRRSMADLSPDDWDRLLSVNATGAYNCMRAVLPAMRERRDGLIINICSIAGMRCGVIGGVAYNASKFAMAALGRTVGNEEHDRGIRVTTIYPGEVDTPILNDRPSPIPPEHRARILQPEDVAAAVLMVIALPPRANVAEIVIKPTAQPLT